MADADDAAYAFQLVSKLMRDEAQPPNLRLEAALEVLHWVRGNAHFSPTNGESREHAVRTLSNVPLANGKLKV